MKHLYTLIIIFLMAFTAQAQFIEFNFDNATVSGNTMIQDVFLNGDGYRITAVHGSLSNAALFDNGNGDFYLEGTGGSRPEQNWTISLRKNGTPENFDFVSVDYLNTSLGATHTFIIGDSSNNAISAQTNIPPSDAGTMIVANQANATNLSDCLIFGLSFFATTDTYFNNLRIRPISLLSSDDKELEKVNYFQNRLKNLVISHSQLEGATIQVLNMNGQVVSETIATATDTVIDVTSVSSGIYIARIQLENRVETIKFSK